MFNLKKGTQLILLLSVNFFSPSVIANQFTMDCGRIIDIDDYKKCTRRKFTESYVQEPSPELLLNQSQDNNQNSVENSVENSEIVIDEIKQTVNTESNIKIDFDEDSVSQIEIDEITDDSDFQKAVDYFKKYQRNDALFHLKRYLSKNPNSKDGYLLKALINLNSFQDGKQALSDLTMAINIDRNFAEAYSWRAEISAVDFNDFKEAERDINKALAILPNDSLVNYHAAIVYIRTAEKFLDLDDLDKAYEFFKKSNFHANKAIATYPNKLNDIYQKVYPFGYLYELHYEVGLNNYEMGWYWKEDKKNKLSKSRPYFDAAVNSFTRAIAIAPSQESTDKLYEEYDMNPLMVADIHYWRGEVYQSYIKGAWWKKACPDFKISKKARNSEFFEDSQRWVRESCY